MKHRSDDLTGQRFGRLLVVERMPTASNGNAMFKAKCDCGNIVVKRGSHLRLGQIKSCGCLHDTHGIGKQYAIKHGYCKTSTYASWIAMHSRCSDKSHPHFEEYGGRGITVCEEWDDFVRFLADMGDRPFGTTLDRKDNNLGYCKSNCRWATPKQQGRNRRNNRLLTARGHTLTISEWSEITGIKNTTIKERLNRGLQGEEALCPT